MLPSTRNPVPVWPFRRAVVTGGCGFIGSHVCDALLMRGTEVVCVDNFLTGSPENLVHWLDDESFSLLDRDVSGDLDVPGNIDLVMHLACPASPIDYLQFPIETLTVGSSGTLNALDLAHRKGARFVLASTSEVYGEPESHPQRESYWGNVNPVGPRSVYDEAKRFSEAATAAYRREFGTNTAVARIFNSYGPRMRAEDGRVVPTFIRQALAGEPLTVNGDGLQTRSLCFVDDTVSGLLALAANDHPGPINLGNPEELTVLQIALLIRELCGSASPVATAPLPTDDPTRRCPDVSLANRELSWAPQKTVREGLAATVKWFRGQLTNPLSDSATSVK